MGSGLIYVLEDEPPVRMVLVDALASAGDDGGFKFLSALRRKSAARTIR